MFFFYPMNFYNIIENVFNRIVRHTIVVLLCIRVCGHIRPIIFWVWKKHSGWVLGWKPYRNIIIVVVRTDCVITCIVLLLYIPPPKKGVCISYIIGQPLRGDRHFLTKTKFIEKKYKFIRYFTHLLYIVRFLMWRNGHEHIPKCVCTKCIRKKHNTALERV